MGIWEFGNFYKTYLYLVKKKQKKTALPLKVNQKNYKNVV